MNFQTFKKGFINITVLFVFLSFLNVSCFNRTKSSDNEVSFDTIQVHETSSIDYKKSKLNCNLTISFIYPVSCKKSSQLVELQKIFIEKSFPPKYANLSPEEALKSFTNQYLSDFQSIKDKDSFEDDYILEDENSYIYELSIENEILYNRNNFISFVVKINNYEGGAHGSNSIYGYVIDLNTGKFLTEEDFAGRNYKKNITPVLIQKIAASKGISDISQLEESMGYKIGDISPNENFTIDDKGLTYYFNEYEIAAYFVGITQVFIPYEDLKSFITNNNPISFLTRQ